MGRNDEMMAHVEKILILEGYAAFTRDAPLAGRNLDRNAEDPIFKATCVITYTGTV